MNTAIKRLMAVLALAGSVVFGVTAAQAHPHVWITASSELLYAADGAITVVELVPEILEWARGPMAEVAAGCLDDPRVLVVRADVAQFISGAADEYDAILLDVDNGPDGLVREDNNVLYSGTGLREAKRALTPGGVLAIWSADPDPAFMRRLQKTGFDVDEVRVAARSNGKGSKHTIWFARRG